MRNFIVTTCAALLMTASAIAGPADPGSYLDHTVGAYSNQYYKEYLLADGELTIIELEGFCSAGQDIDLWVYENNSLIAKSTSYGCYEKIELRTHRDHWLTIRVENEGKPYNTRYNLHIW